MILKKL